MSELPDMRASDTERDRVAEALREALAEGRLDMDEFDQRLGAAYKARTHGELDVLVRDLPAPSRAAEPARGAPEGGGEPDWPERVGGRATSRWGVAIMGGFQRGGPWTAPRVFNSVAFWGGGQIDLREARFEDRDIVIRCFAIMGGMEIVVPPDVEVHVNGVGIMGGFDDKASGPGAPGAPRVTVSGLAFWGGVGVKRKERKAVRKAQREERRLEREERRKSVE
ncbi:DUF1707 SHOCT-like domain-containing protein, partial [Streptomyces varsoviensis]|uniref:DUF1707 domain-containing protein n=1 Tax=Streptomyces varsoviensis TaxID=67373 RepID=A0ABR5IUC3_9ACTN